ncbi:MAG: hypothetical protein KJ578_12805 [Bacteroidetes bacterium]|nr:hypothetical protein [Bacteroidota bacterium]MBU1578997.1 hypothetical protein [Bacteroidota bacterium]MBU2466354.1 hypothetical protein [Bacteroidota bacterium]MBU2558649.1 hypothetical protein [Bacteroidota bacterium]
MSVVSFASDRILVMNNGRLEELAEVDTLFQQPLSDYTKKLIGAVMAMK